MTETVATKPESAEDSGFSLMKAFKKGAANYLHFESAKNSIVNKAKPLLHLIPGLGPVAAEGIGVVAGTLSKIQKMAANALDGTDTISADKVADTVIADAKEQLPGLLTKAGKADIAARLTASV